jgi:hypothetical protein
VRRARVSRSLGVVALAAVGLTAASVPGGAAVDSRTTICHRTPAGKHPYARIIVTAKQLEVHLAHAADVIPAPRARCPRLVLSPFRGGVVLTAVLSGANEPSGHGDPDGKGRAVVRLRRGEGRLCFELLAANVALPAYASHVHRGRAGQTGPVVVSLRAPDETGGATGCTNVERRLVAEILRDPAAFYVNVHTSEFLTSAIRGQL